MSQPENDSAGHGAYVQKVREDTQRYIQSLLAENERLRRRNADLDTEVRRLSEENDQTRRRLHELEGQMEGFREERSRLQRHLDDIETENQRFSQQFVEVERRNSDLANLYVATYRLHGTLDREEVLRAIEEIIINLIGCEEFVVFEVEPGGDDMAVIGSFGMDTHRFRAARVGRGLIGRAAQTGEKYLAADGLKVELPEEEHLTGCIPMRIADRVAGVIAIFRLLPQKGNQFAPVDEELFDVLATQAAPAVYCTALHARLGVTV